jgi:hypothetical protein
VSRRATPTPIDGPCPFVSGKTGAVCGQVHDPAKCVGHVDADDGSVRPCKLAPRKGQRVCGSHGGRAPQNLAAAARRLEEKRVEHELGKLLVELEGEASDANPIEVLLGAMRRASAMAAAVGWLTSELDPHDLYGPDHLDDAKPHVLTEMYRTWNGESGRLAKLAIDAGVAERLVRLEEAQGEAMVAITEKVVDAIWAAFLAAGVAVDLLKVVRAQQLPSIMRDAIVDVTGRDG